MRNHPVIRPAAVLAVAALAALLTAPATAEAQDGTLSWTETSTFEVPGTLGALLRAMPGALDSRSSEQSLHVQGDILIQDDGNQATIMNAETHEIITIDHEAETYMVITLEQSVEAAREMTGLVADAREGADEALDEARAEREEAMAEMRQAMEEAREAFSFNITTDATGRTRNFGDAGTAEQHMITAELEAVAPPQGVEDAEAGSIVFLMELWQSHDMPTPDDFYERWGEGLAQDPEMQALTEELAGSAESVSDASAEALAMWDPRMSAGLDQLADVVEGLEGTTVQSVTTVALVPAGVALNRDELLNWEPESMGDRIQAEASDAVRGAARDAARNALSGLSSRFGGGGDDEDEAEEQVVRPLFRLTTVKEDIVHGPTGNDELQALQQRIEGYREITMEELMRQAEEARQQGGGR